MRHIVFEFVLPNCSYSAQGLVEIYWRGKVDHHGTMFSTSHQGYTRCGTSVQITQKVVQGVGAWKKHGQDADHVVDVKDCLKFTGKSLKATEILETALERGLFVI